VVIVGFVGVVGLLVYATYGQVNSFAEQLPAYSHRIRQTLTPLVHRFERVQKNAESIGSVDPPKRVPEVKVKRTMPDWPSYVADDVGSISSALVIVAVVPFLTFFMLIGKQHLHRHGVFMVGPGMDLQKFSCELNHTIRGFVVGNLIGGAMLAGPRP
jgi:predicted PurR-regulated permease PerM